MLAGPSSVHSLMPQRGVGWREELEGGGLVGAAGAVAALPAALAAAVGELGSTQWRKKSICASRAMFSMDGNNGALPSFFAFRPATRATNAALCEPRRGSHESIQSLDAGGSS